MKVSGEQNITQKQIEQKSICMFVYLLNKIGATKECVQLFLLHQAQQVSEQEKHCLHIEWKTIILRTATCCTHFRLEINVFAREKMRLFHLHRLLNHSLSV